MNHAMQFWYLRHYLSKKKACLKLFCYFVVSRSPTPDGHQLCIQFALPLVYCVGRYVNEVLRLCSLICALSVNHPQKCPRPSVLF